MIYDFYAAIAAGLCISIGSAVYCAQTNIFGAIAFAIGLLIICKYKFALYTGRIGYCKIHKDECLFECYSTSFKWMPWIIVGNLIGTLVFGTLIGLGSTYLHDMAASIINIKESIPLVKIFINAIFCGIIIFIAVDMYKNGSLLGILFGVPIFILCGWEHSIADMCYYAISMQYSITTIHFLLTVILGNAIGSLVANKLFSLTKNVNLKN